MSGCDRLSNRADATSPAPAWRCAFSRFFFRARTGLVYLWAFTTHNTLYACSTFLSSIELAQIGCQARSTARARRRRVWMALHMSLFVRGRRASGRADRPPDDQGLSIELGFRFSTLFKISSLQRCLLTQNAVAHNRRALVVLYLWLCPLFQKALSTVTTPTAPMSKNVAQCSTSSPKTRRALIKMP